MPTDAYVNATDQIDARNNPHFFFDPASIDDRYDYNRDKNVNATDQIIARNNAAFFFNALKLMAAPSGQEGLAEQADGRDIPFTDLAWLSEYDLSNVEPESSQDGDPIDDAADKFLETYWP